MRILICLLLLIAGPLRAHADTRPNVVVIMTDDHGTLDLQSYGSRDLVTPSIDSLAKAGIRFTQFYAAAPVCSPSRAALLTGRYPWVCGVPSNTGVSPSESTDDLGSSKVPGLPPSETTMATLFRKAGYRTAHVGKWHLGSAPGYKPLDHGFDYSFGHMGGCIDNFSHFFYWAGPNVHDLWENNQRVRLPGKFFPDLMVEKATAFIDRSNDEPFFLYFAANMPHYPYQGDEKWLKHYAHLPHPRRLYAAFLSTLDERIGALLAHLKARGLTEKTIVVFQSDNGHSVEERAHFGGGSAGAYRGAKFSLFEGGIRVPAIISWPARIPSGEARGQVAHACDWFSTLAELCGVPLPDLSLQGKSLVPLLKNSSAPSPHSHLVWKVGEQQAVRSGPWKLLHKPVDTANPGSLGQGDRDWFLVNLEEDPSEKVNLLQREPEQVSRLKQLMVR